MKDFRIFAKFGSLQRSRCLTNEETRRYNVEAAGGGRCPELGYIGKAIWTQSIFVHR